MWIMAKTIMQQPLLVNTNNVALIRNTGQESTAIVLRDGSEYVIDMLFDDVAMKIHQHDPAGLA
jgi:hypothetical protein